MIIVTGSRPAVIRKNEKAQVLVQSQYQGQQTVMFMNRVHFQTVSC